MLNESQIDQWRQDGFITLPAFFTSSQRENISRSAEEIARWEPSDDKWLMWFEKTIDGRKIVSKAENFLEYNANLREELLADGRIQASVETLLDEKVRILKELLIFKYPDSGGFKPHQDIYHVPHNIPFRMVHAVVAVGIDDSGPDNGGLFFSPRNHTKGVFPMDAGGVIHQDVSDHFSWEPVSWKAGDVFIFDDHAPHYSRPNHSDRSRRTLYLVFQRDSTGGPSRDEYNLMKRAYNPPESRTIDIDNLKPSNGIFYRE